VFLSKPHTKTRREIEFETRRSFIVDTARRLITEGDIETTSMDAIAAAVQYTRRTLYAYFKSRDEILLQVYTEDLARRWKVQQVALAVAQAGLEKIRVWGETFFEYSRDHPTAVRLQAYWSYRGIDRSKINEKRFANFEAQNIELAEGLREIFRLGVSDDTLRHDLDVDLCVSHYIYSLTTIIHRAMSPTYSFARFDPENYVHNFLDLFCRGIRNSEEHL
jgi:AcrR family transcriptional regulator